jgi:uncharacterized protein (DUF305 family)
VKALLLSLAAVIAIAVAGCGGSGGGANTGANAYTIPFIAQNDVQYIDAMVPHHLMAIDMAQMVLDRGASVQIKAIAQAIKDAQGPEIAAMKAVRKTLTGSDVIPTPPRDPYLDKMMMDMEAMSGAQLDMMFLKSMIGHHSEAIAIAERALDQLNRADMKANAEAVISDQAREIGEMQALR